MSTDIRAELSKSNKYHIDRERYYELKHFCLQYNSWKRLACSTTHICPVVHTIVETNWPTRSCEIDTIQKIYYTERIELIEQCAYDADSVLSFYILKSVTDGFTYPQMKARWNIPCGKDMFYDRYHKFFWILDKKRD